MSVTYHSSSNVTDASFSPADVSLACTITTGTSKTLKIDICSNKPAGALQDISLHTGTGPQFRIVFTDRNAYGTSYGSGNAVTVKNISLSDISMHTGNKKLTFSITDDKLVDGATTGVQVTYMVKASDKSENQSSTTSAKFNSTPLANVDGSNVLVNGGPNAPPPDYQVFLNPNGSTSDSSLAFVFGSALTGNGVDISKLEVIMTDQTDLDISVVTVNLTAGKLQTTGDLTNRAGTNNKAFEFAVATVDEFGVKSAHVGTKFTAASSAKAAAPTSISTKGNFKSGGRADISWTAPTYAPKPIEKYNVYFMQAKDASLVTSSNAMNATQAKAKSLGQVVTTTSTKATVTGLDNSSNVAFFVAAVTKDANGNDVEGIFSTTSAVDVSDSQTAVTGSNTHRAKVVGPPTVTQVIAARGGRQQYPTVTGAIADVSMRGQLTLVFNDVNVKDEGQALSAYQYTVLETAHVGQNPEGAAALFANDASYNAFPTGNQISLSPDAAIDEASLNKIYYTLDASNKFVYNSAGIDLSLGTSYSVKIVAVNSVGAGTRHTNPLTATPSSLPNPRKLFKKLGDSNDGASQISLHATGKVLRTDVSMIESGANKIIIKFADTDASGNSLINATGGLAVSAFNVQVTDDISSSQQAGGTGTRTDICQAFFFDASLTKQQTLFADASTGQSQPHSTAFNAGTKLISLGANSGALEVTKYQAQDGTLKNLINGVPYSIKLSAANANGQSDDASAITFMSKAPFSTPGVPVLKQGTTPPTIANTNQLALTISLEELSGNAQHGGLVLSRYDISISQTVGSTKRFIFSGPLKTGGATGTGTGNAYTPVNVHTGAAGNKVNLAASNYAPMAINGTTLNPVLGYAINIEAQTVALESDQQCPSGVFMPSGTVIRSATATYTFDGPTQQLNEVRGLLGSIGDKTLGLSWTAPDLSFLLSNADKQLVGGAANAGLPVITSYKVELFDCSMTSGKAIDTETKNVTINHVAGQMVYSSTFTNLVNGKAYVPRVVVNYSFANGAQTNSTEGAYLNQNDLNTKPVSTNGLTDIKTAVTTTNFVNSASGTGVIAVPGGIPLITPTLSGTTAGLKIDDNGRPLTFGAMIQIVPKPNATATAGTNSFYVDLSATTGTAPLSSAVAVTGNSFRNIHTLNTAYVGNNWATEKNYIFAANSVGTRVVTTNISTAQLQASGSNIVELNSQY
jgi:hypothetical protein